MIKKSKQIHKEQFPFKPRTLLKKFDLCLLSIKFPDLAQFVSQNDYGLPTLDYRNPKAISLLNEAIMKHYFKIQAFHLPKDVMQPFLGGRINYIEWISEQVKGMNKLKKKVFIVDVGCGSSAIYLLLANKLFKWEGLGIDSETKFIDNACKIIEDNNLPIQLCQHSGLSKKLQGLIPENKFVVTVCNPPFYDTSEERKMYSTIAPEETFTEGGEFEFIKKLFEKSKTLKCDFYTSLIGRKTSYVQLIEFFKEQDQESLYIVTGKLYQGNNVRWVIGWKFK